MQVAVQMEFKVDRRELLGALIRRVAEQFRQAAVEPNIVASFADGPSGILWGHLWTAGGPADAYGPLPW